MRYRTLCPLLVLACLLAAGCGGGDGTPAGPGAAFAGPYWMFELRSGPVFSSQWPGIVTLWGTAYADGEAGFVTDMVFYGGNPLGEFPATYAVADDLSFAAEKGGHAWDGGMTQYGRCVVAGYVGSWYNGLAILLSRVGTYDETDLAGSYHMVGFERGWAFYKGSSLSGSVLTFDGSGHYTATAVTRTGVDMIREVTPDTDLTYSVAANGLVSMDDVWKANRLEGGIQPGGQVVVAAGGSGDREGPVMYALIKAEQEVSNATFSGAYWTAGLRRTYDAVSGFYGVITADGTGGYTWEGMDRTQGESDFTESTVAGTYEVAADGTFTFTTSGGEILVGGISADGQYFALGGETTPSGVTPRGGSAFFVFGAAKTQ